MNENTFSQHGAGFQEKLAFHILEDRIFCDRMAEVLKIEFLEKKYIQVFVEKIFTYKKKYGTHPSYETMKMVLRSGLNDENDATQKQVRDFFARIAVNGDSLSESADFIKEEALDFCRKQKVKEAMIKATKLLKNRSFDEISVLINDALKAGGDNDFGYNFIADFEERYVQNAQERITFGWNSFDAITNGGMAKGTLGVVIAPTGGGKSMVLTHLGAVALKNKNNVIHYTLELGTKDIGLRYDSCLTGIKLDELPDKKDKVLEKIKTIPGKLIIKQYPTKTATTNTIRTHLESLKKKDIVPDVIIVDYADLLRPLGSQREKRDELESVYEELRAIAMEYNVIVWTASQTNRSGLNEEVITMSNIAEAFNKCFVADFIFTVSRREEDKVNSKARFLVAKNRSGPEGSVFDVDMDTSKVKIAINGVYSRKASAPATQNQLRDVYKQIQMAKEN